MVKCNPKTTEQPVETVADPLTVMLRQGAKELIAQAVVRWQTSGGPQWLFARAISANRLGRRRS